MQMKFEALYLLYWQKVYRLCMGYVNNADWAKDIAQDSFINILQALPKFRNDSAIETWVFRIASNQCLRQIEKDKRLPKSEFPFEVEEIQTTSIENEVSFLYKSISELPEVDRVIISLELEDIKQAEIAKIVGLSESNIRIRIHRIKEKLSQKFKNYEH